MYIQGNLITPRELEVWKETAEGHPSKAIAAKFGTSVKTVDAQRVSLYRKIGARSIADATRAAIRHGIITIEVLPSATQMQQPSRI